MTETRYIEGRERYALAEVVGHGGFSTVWRAVSRKGEEVAVKIIPVSSDPERARAMREGQIAEGLRHPNIVETLEVIPGEQEVYLVTEFVRGTPLDTVAKGYTMEEVVDALAQILEGLLYAHGQGIIHRDIKPQNALVDARGTVKLTDFGIAYRAGDTRLTRVGYAVGTPGYIAPEIMSGSDPSELTDIYAVGASARTILSRNPEEPTPRLRKLIDRATSPNPAHRPQDAREALTLLTGGRAPATRKSILEREERLPEKITERAQRALNGLVAGGLGYLLGGALLTDGAAAAGVAAGCGVLGYLLPRLGALGVIVALAVVLLRNPVVGLGFGAVVPAVGAVWVAAGRGGLARLPLGPLLAVPAVVAGLGAGLPLLFGALMRPLGAALSAAAGAVVLVVYEVTLGGDRLIPYIGGSFRQLPASISPVDLLGWFERLMVEGFPEIPLLIALWAAMAAVVSLGEWFGRPFIGLAVAGVGGALGYALAVSSPATLDRTMISLGFAAIIYGLLRYIGSWVRR